MNSAGQLSRPSSVASGAETLSRAQCLELLHSCSVGRFGTTMDAMPAVLPVNYAMFREDILVRTTFGSRLDAAVANSVVAFEIDSYSPDGSSGWSVQVRGVARDITDPDDLEAASKVSLHHMATPGVPRHHLVISTLNVSGRRFDHRR